MSKSYKKTPYYTDHTRGTKYWKRLANKRVRRYNKDLANGTAYKKVSCSYDIHDYVSYWSKEEAILNYYTKLCYNWITNQYERLWGEYETEQDFLQHWAKFYRRK